MIYDYDKHQLTLAEVSNYLTQSVQHMKALLP